MPPIPASCIWLAVIKSTLFLSYLVISYGGVGLGSVFIFFNGLILATAYFGVTKRKFRKSLCLVIVVIAEVLLVESLYHYMNGRDYRRSCEIISTVRRSDDHQVHDIFFLQTSSHPSLSPRTACAIESAAFHHPNWTVTLYSISTVDEDDGLRTLRALPNFRLLSLDLGTLYQASPLRAWYQRGDFASSPYSANKLSNPTRYLLLYRQGGIYLDSDVIVLRSLSDLRNALGLEHMFSVNNAVLIFDKQHPLLRTVIERFEKSYTSDTWGTEGPKLFTKLLPEVCSNSSLWSMASYDYMMHPERCPGFTVLPSYAFYPLWFFPVPFYNIFRAEANIWPDLSCSYALHLWNSMTKDWHSRVDSTQLMDVVARENCPNVYENVVKKHRVGI